MSAAQCRLQEICRVDCSLGRTCADKRVHFIDKQDDILRTPQLCQNVTHPLLKLTAVFRSGD